MRRQQSSVTTYLRFLRPSGFTLLELMVCVAIIFILAAIVLSAIPGAKGRASRIKCNSNLRQLLISAHMFADDTEDTLPKRSLVQPWISQLRPYYSTDAVLNYPLELNHRRSYLMNVFGDWFHSTLDTDEFSLFTDYLWEDGFPIAAAKNPSDTILFGEKLSHSGHVHMDFFQGSGNDLEEIDHDRHAGGANSAFLDGSVRWLRAWETVSPINLWAVTDQWRDPGD